MIKYSLISLLLALTAASAYVIDARSPALTPSKHDLAATRSIYAMGIVEGVTPDVQLRPESCGRAVEVLVAANDFVKSGDVLVRLDDRREMQLVAERRAKLELAQAQLERLLNGAQLAERSEARALLDARRARLDEAVKNWNRIEQLQRQAAAPQQEADEKLSLVRALTGEVRAAEARLEQLEAPAREDEVRAAKAKVAAADAEYSFAKIALEKCSLRTPTDGCVLDISVESGELIGPESPTPAVVIADTSKLRVRAYVEEIDAPRVKVGMPAQVTADGLPDAVFKGHVGFLSPRMTPKLISDGRPDELYDTKIREVLIDLDDDAGLIVGLQVDVRL